MKNLILICCLALVATSSCLKEKEEPKSAKEYLTTGTWKMTGFYSITLIDGALTTVDEFALAEECEKDNYFRYAPDGKYVTNYGSLKCDSSEADQKVGTWKLTPDYSVIILEEDSVVRYLGILSVNEDYLVLGGKDESNTAFNSTKLMFSHR